MSSRSDRHALRSVYGRLYKAFGPQRWWPGDTPFEVAIGAILTQNTAWTNVERAIKNIKAEGRLSFRAMERLSEKRLAGMIRPAGYFNIKARRLKHFLRFLKTGYGGSMALLRKRRLSETRRALLGVNGIGPETADSILLYALDKPVFVIDAYTRRVFARHGLIRADADYDKAQKFFMDRLPSQTRLYNEYHALIVRLGKEFCHKTRPRCAACPLHEKN
jgi:endonuclease-3 related protein